jgi:hypothetical protein
MLALAALILIQTAFAFAAEQVDLLLVLSSDVSRSVDHPKFLLQREGYAAAISDPHVMDAIKSGPQQRIALCFVEWSGFGAQKLVIDWTIIDGPDAARKFGDQLLELPRSFADRTSISGGIEFAAAQLERAPFGAARRTIDVSGDGTNNAGRAVECRAYQSAWRPREILPRQRHRRPGRVRSGGRELQLVRPRHHQETDRRDCRAVASTSSTASHRRALRPVAACRLRPPPDERDRDAPSTHNQLSSNRSNRGGTLEFI